MLSLAIALLLSQTYPPPNGGPMINGVDQGGNPHPFAVNPGGALPMTGAAPSYSIVNSYSNGQGDYGLIPLALVGDGGPAVVVANYTTNTVSCYLVQANGALGQRIDTTVLNAPRQLATADFNQDGIADIALTNRTALVGVYFGDGGCGFNLGTPTILDAGAGITALQGIAAGPLGFASTGNPPSIVAGDRSSFGIATFLGQGDGGFLPATVQDAGGGGIAEMRLVDLDQNGEMDLVTIGNSTVGTISTLYGHANQTFTNCGTYTTQASGPSGLATATHNGRMLDFNSDGVADIVITGSAASASYAGFEIFFGRMDAPLQSGCGYALNAQSVYYPFVSGDFAGLQGVAAGDFNGDGFVDVVGAAGPGLGQTGLLIATGDGRGHLSRLPILSNKITSSSNQQMIYVATADLNSDGHPDLIGTNFSGSSTIPNLFTWLSSAPTSITPALGATFQVAPFPGSMLGASNGPATPTVVNCNSTYATYLGQLPSRRSIAVQTQYDSTPIWIGGPNVCAQPGYGFSSSDAGFVDAGACVVGEMLQPGGYWSKDVNLSPSFPDPSDPLASQSSGYASNGFFCIKASGAQDGTPDGGWTRVTELP